MAQYAVDFEDDTLGALPAGWTERWASSGDWEAAQMSDEASEKGLIDATGAGRALVSRDEVEDGDHADVEMYALGNIVTAADEFSIVLRGAFTTEEVGYRFRYFPDTGELVIQAYGFSSGTLGSATVSLDTSQRVELRARANGTALKFKAWQGSEPSGWDIETTDGDISAAGWNGPHHFGGTDNEWAFVGFGTAGDPAPTAAPDEAVSVSVADTISLADTRALAATANGAVADSIAFTDARGITVMASGQVADAFALADAIEAALTANASVAGALGLLDNRVEGNIFAETVSDSLTLTDAVAGTLTLSEAVADALSLADNSALSVSFDVALADSITYDDALEAALSVGAEVSDAVQFADALTHGGSFADVTLPDERTLRIDPENRTITIAAENRTITA